MSYDASRRTVLTAVTLAALTATASAAGPAAASPIPSPAPVPPPHWPGGSRALAHRARGLLAGLSLEEKVGQLFVSRVYGHHATEPEEADAAKNLAAFGVRTPAEVVARYRLGGVIYFAWANNTRSPRAVAGLSNGLQRAASLPLLLSVDQEHGAVARIGRPATLFPGAMALGAAGTGERALAGARRAARIAGAELAALGVRQNWAPVADVNVNPANPVIGVRSFGSDPEAVAALVAAQVRGYAEGGVAAAAKHFPGHGDTATDSHVGLPVVTHTRAEWERWDEPPFRAAIEAGAEAVMTAHIVVPALDPSGDPATLSRPIVTGLLRERLGFDGVVVTDALDMAGVRQKYGDDRVPVLALRAGCDQLLNAPDLGLAVRSVLAAVRSGELTEERVDASVLRILLLKLRRGLFADPFVDEERVGDRLGTARNLAAAREVAAGGTTLLANPRGVLPLARGARVLVTAAVEPASPTGTTGPPTAVLARELTAAGLVASAAPAASAVEAARGCAAVVVCTVNVPAPGGAASGPSAAEQGPDAAGGPAAAAGDPQRELVTALLATGVPVVQLALRNPYDGARLPECAAELASYGWGDVEMGAAAGVLAGARRPTGRLPVPVPGRWPLGHGLTY
ncbi:glycoside hydrolase family 3 protein [Streptomyces sp. BI20]|uniref:glycoside hydrolase family 3 protein n=1 Tax=Streptomyces sp. BI20 TaxID=3403460 RepID=UPI003C75BDF7